MRKSFVLHRGAAWRLAAACGVCPLVLAAADVSAQTMTVAFGLRETGVDPGQVGGNGGATGGIEWIGLADNKVLTLDGSWQQFTFNFGGPNASSIAAFAGATANGMYDGIWGTIENLRINNSSAITNTVRLHIDDIVNTVGGTPTVVSGFEAGDPFPATVGTEHVFQEPRFSGSTQSFLVPTSSSLVTDQAAHSGTQSDEMIFTFNGTGGNTAWARITTFNTPNQGNPAINFAEGNSLSFWLRAEILPPDQRWIAPGSGNWDDPNNWGTGVVPNGTLSVANFLGDATSAATVTLNNPITINTVRLNNANTFTFVGPNTLTFTGAAQDARNINVEMGNHVFNAPITVNMGAGTSALMNFNVARAQDVLTVNSDITIDITNAGTITFQKAGPGRLDITNIETSDSVLQPVQVLVSQGTMRFLPNSGRNFVNGVSITGGPVPTAKLDITNNPLVIDHLPDASPIATIEAQIASAFNNGAWDGNGITSSQANSSQLGIGYAQSSELPSVPALFGTVDADALLLRLTRYGDANLDGTVNLADFNRLASNFGAEGADWVDGDFNYDNIVNLADFNRLASNFGLSAAGPDVTPEDWAALAAAVPEPSGLALVGAALLCATRRRRRA